MATNTYVALDKVTVGSAVSSITFSSVNSGYTDLVIVCNGTGGISSNDASILIQLNGDTASNYSTTYLLGDGTSAASGRIGPSSAIYSMRINGTTNSTGIAHIQNYSNSTTYKTILSRGNSPQYAIALVGLWRSTAAITSITLTEQNAGNFQSGFTASLYGIKADTSPNTGTTFASGGTITKDNMGYVYHTFTAGGTFTPSKTLALDVLVVGGGAGGCGYGAGGAGGLLYQTGRSASSGVGYTVTVGGSGAGGAAGGSNTAANGNPSTFDTITALGGGGGATQGDAPTGGGSGGGGGYNNGIGAAGEQGNSGGATGFGFAGGNGRVGASNSYPYMGGGGGGSAGPGQTGSLSTSPHGGLGTMSFAPWLAITSTGVSGRIAGGGGGAQAYSGGGTGGSGSGGGGNGASYSGGGTNATANTGGGGGGSVGTTGANGGSGLVIIRYLGV
jgi:hypothetical protein